MKQKKTYEVVATEFFIRELRPLAKRYRSLEADLDVLTAALESDPSIGTSLGGGVRKIRLGITSKNKGKSGGARVITFYQEGDSVYLLSIFDKSEKSDIPKQLLKGLVASVRSLTKRSD